MDFLEHDKVSNNKLKSDEYKQTLRHDFLGLFEIEHDTPVGKRER